MNLLLRLVLIAASLLGLAAPVGAADVDLAPKWRAGDEAVFLFTNDSSRHDAVPAMQAAQDQRTRQEMTIRRKVVETGPAGTSLELVFERIKVVITQGRMFMLYDSAKPPEVDRSNVLEDAIKPLIGVPLKVKLNADNTVTEISGFPQPRTVDGAVRALVVDEELVRYSLAGMYGLQKKPASANIGDKWIVDEELPGEPGTVLLIRHQRKLASADAAIAVVTSKATSEIKPVTPGARSQRLMSIFDCSSEQHWDLAKGRMGWMVLDQKIEMTGVVKQARSEHLTTVRMTLASEGHTPPPPPKNPSSEEPGQPPGSPPNPAP